GPTTAPRCPASTSAEPERTPAGESPAPTGATPPARCSAIFTADVGGTEHDSSRPALGAAADPDGVGAADERPTAPDRDRPAPTQDRGDTSQASVDPLSGPRGRTRATRHSRQVEVAPRR